MLSESEGAYARVPLPGKSRPIRRSSMVLSGTGGAIAGMITLVIRSFTS